MEHLQENSDWTGRQLGKYQILKLLGCGSMGAVYQAMNVILEKVVCLKILFPRIGNRGGNEVPRFLREARAIARLDHPHIVRVYDIDEKEGIHFIVMEYIRGKSLDQIFQEVDAFTIRETLRIGVEIAEALAEAHSHDIVHRDIKPANIMIEDGHVKLTDFGLARIGHEAGETTSNVIVGTPLYIAPERIGGGVMDSRVDLYSLGVTLYQMLVGDPPYTAEHPADILHMHLASPIPSARAARHDVPPELDAIVRKLMAKRAQDRFATAEETAQALRRCAVEFQETLNAQTMEMPCPAAVRKYQESILGSPQRRNPKRKISVLVVEDSHTMGEAIARILNEEGDFELSGIARNGVEALQQIAQRNPDVVTLDFNMPEMDGITAVKQIMSRCPRPVIMLSGFTYDGAWTTLECLACGALDFIWKTSHSQWAEFRRNLVDKIRNAARVKLTVHVKPRIRKSLEMVGQPKSLTITPARTVVALVAGEGGCQACLKILPYIPKHIPCAVILFQQMQESMADDFCAYLDHNSRLVVQQIKDHQILYDGVCYVGNHGTRLRFERAGSGQVSMLRAPCSDDAQGSPVNEALKLLSQKFPSQTIGILLSGTDAEVLAGFRDIRESGGEVLVQSPETCLWPGAAPLAMEQKLADKVVPDVDIPSVLWHVIKNRASSKADPMANTAKKILPQAADAGREEPRKARQEDSQSNRGAQKKQRESILLAEDDKMAQKIIRHCLEEEGYAVAMVEDGADAAFALESQAFDLIISDIRMPRFDGWQLLELKKQREIETPLMFVTASLQEDDEIRALKMGASDYVRKPIHKELLLLRVRNCLKSRKMSGN